MAAPAAAAGKQPELPSMEAPPALPSAEVNLAPPDAMLPEEPAEGLTAAERATPRDEPELPSAAVGVELPKAATVEETVPITESTTPESARQPSNPPKKPAPPEASAGVVSTANPPSFNADDLDSALEAVRKAVAVGAGSSAPEEKAADGPPESLDDSSDVLSADAYTELCELAELLAFVADAEAGGQLASRKLAAHDLVQRIGQSKANVRAIARLALEHLEDTPRQSSGILLAGKVEEVRAEGMVHTAIVKLASAEQRVTLSSSEPLGLEPAESVLVLGSLVADPGEKVAASAEGDRPASQVVRCATVVKF
jgi:hypothetical protein